MEVCFKCHLPINENDKFIIGDPDGKQRGLWWNGDWSYSSRGPKPIEKNKYHLTCFNDEKKYYRRLYKKKLRIGLAIACGIIVVFAGITAVVIKLILSSI